MVLESILASLDIYSEIVRQYNIDVWYRFIELVHSPVDYPDMIWILTPLLLTMLLMELYFGRYKFEELGWNTAFANTLVLIFVSIDLIRFLYNHGQMWGFKLAVVIAVIIVGVILVFLDFFHLLPRLIAFSMSSKLPINFVALSAVLLIYTEMPIDYITFGSFILLLIILYIILTLIHYLEPGSLEELEKEAPE